MAESDRRANLLSVMATEPESSGEELCYECLGERVCPVCGGQGSREGCSPVHCYYGRCIICGGHGAMPAGSAARWGNDTAQWRALDAELDSGE